VHKTRRPATPVVSYEDCLLLAEGIDEANNISAQLENIVVLDGLWPVTDTVRDVLICHVAVGAGLPWRCAAAMARVQAVGLAVGRRAGTAATPPNAGASPPTY
jgi:hypothetical protein